MVSNEYQLVSANNYERSMVANVVYYQFQAKMIKQGGRILNPADLKNSFPAARKKVIKSIAT